MNDTTRATVTESLLNAASVLSGSAERGRAYVLANLAKLDDSALEDAERSLKAADLTVRCGVYVSRSGEVGNTRLRVDLLGDISKLEEQINKSIGATYGDIDFKAFDSVAGLVVRHSYLRHKSGNSYTISNSGYPLPDLLAFLDYIVKGKNGDSYTHIYKWLDESGNKQAMYEPAYELEYEGVKVKKFKNGRLDLVFPKPAQATKAQETLTAWHAAKQR